MLVVIIQWLKKDFFKEVKIKVALTEWLEFICDKAVESHDSKNAKKHSWESEKCGLTLEKKDANVVWYQMVGGSSILE